MSTELMGLVISATTATVLALLFRFEQSRGMRFLAPARVWFDRLISRFEMLYEAFTATVFRDVFRQSIHYFFHTILSVVLKWMYALEGRIQKLLRSNRMLAKKMRTGTTERNKLHEIADHKASVALTEEEKRKHREESLQG